MTKFLRKLSLGLAGAALLSTGVVTSVFAGTTISGNGADSVNKIEVSNHCHSSVTQSNNLKVTTVAYVSANSGENQANENTGGDVTTTTGDATAGASVTVVGGDNTATAPDCCACVVDGDNAITGNGVDTHNTIKNKSHQKTSVKQKNKTSVTSVFTVKANSGKNKNNKNTGSGVDTSTGDTVAGAVVEVTAPSNSL